MKKLLLLLAVIFLGADTKAYTTVDQEQTFWVEAHKEARHPWDRDEFMRQRTVKIANNDGGRTGWGAGVLLSKGRILTCAHVVTGSDKKVIGVLLYGETTFVRAKIIAIEPIKDIAILEIADKTSRPFVYLEPNFKYREDVWLVGNPLGEDFEIAQTHLSQIDRFSYQGGYKMTIMMFPCDKMTHGYSGGPMFNSEGSVIGINEIGLQSDDFIRELLGPTLGNPPKHYCGSIPVREILQRFPFLKN